MYFPFRIGCVRPLRHLYGYATVCHNRFRFQSRLRLKPVWSRGYRENKTNIGIFSVYSFHKSEEKIYQVMGTPPHRVLLFVLQSRRKIGCTFWSRERLYFSGEIMLRIDRSVRWKMLRIGLGCPVTEHVGAAVIYKTALAVLRGWLSPAGHKPGRHSFAVMSVPMNRAKGLFFRRHTHL